MSDLSHAIQLSHSQDVSRIIVTREYQILSWEHQQQQITTAGKEIERDLNLHTLLDLSGISDADSAIVTLIIRFWRLAAQLKGTFGVLAGSESVHDQLRFSGLADKIPVYLNEEDADAALGLSRSIQVRRRETSLLKWVSPLAAGAALISVVTLLSATHEFSAPQPGTALCLPLLSGLLSSCCGCISASREQGAARPFSATAGIVGFVALVATLGHTTADFGG